MRFLLSFFQINKVSRRPHLTSLNCKSRKVEKHKMLKTIATCLLVTVLLSSCFFESADSHSFPMTRKRREEAARLNKGKDLPVIWSYHIHCMFINGDPDSVTGALQLRERFIAHFNLSQVERCQSLFDDIRLCMFGKLTECEQQADENSWAERDFSLKDVEMVPELNSPFISGNWAAMVPIEWFDKGEWWYMDWYSCKGVS